METIENIKIKTISNKVISLIGTYENVKEIADSYIQEDGTISREFESIDNKLSIYDRPDCLYGGNIVDFAWGIELKMIRDYYDKFQQWDDYEDQPVHSPCYIKNIDINEEKIYFFDLKLFDTWREFTEGNINPELLDVMYKNIDDGFKVSWLN